MKNNVSLHQGQYEALATDKRIILEMAGQGGGKSHTIGFRTAVFASMFPETIGLICANTYTQLSDATITRCKEVWKTSFGWTEYHKKNNVDGDYIVGLKPPLHFKQHKIFDKYHNKIFFRNGKVYIFGSMDAYENIDGIEVAHVEMDETKDTREKAVKDVVIGRCRQAGICVISDTQLACLVAFFFLL